MESFKPLTEFSFDQMQATTEWWDKLWENTYLTTSSDTGTLIFGHTTYVARIILVFLIPFWIMNVAKTMGLMGGFGGFQERLPDIVRLFLSIFFVIIVLGNGGANAGKVAYDSRQLSKFLVAQTYEVQILGTSLNNAVYGTLLTESARDEIRKDANACDAMPHPSVPIPSFNPPEGTELTQDQQDLIAYYQCQQAIVSKIESAKNNAPKYCYSGNEACASFFDYLDRVGSSISGAISTEAEKLFNGEPINVFAPVTGAADIFAGSAAMAALKPFLAFSQWLYVSTLELTLWLSGLIAPIAVAFSLIPGQFLVFARWALTFFAITLNMILYAIIVGASAFLLQNTSGAGISEIGFPIMLAFGAPIAASKLIFSGAAAVANAYTQRTAGAAAGAVTLAAAAAAPAAAPVASAAATTAASVTTSASSQPQ